MDIEAFTSALLDAIKHSPNYYEGSFERKAYKQFDTIKICKSAVLRIWRGKVRTRIDIGDKYAVIIGLSESLSLPGTDGTGWFSLYADEEVIQHLMCKIVPVYNRCYEDEPAEVFGCCSRYIECSDAMCCLHPDKRLARGCTYKEHLTAGRIFYGENRNI